MNQQVLMKGKWLKPIEVTRDAIVRMAGGYTGHLEGTRLVYRRIGPYGEEVLHIDTLQNGTYALVWAYPDAN